MNPPSRHRTLVIATLLAVAGAAPWGLTACSASLLPKPPAAAARYTLDAAMPAPPRPLKVAAGAPVLLVEPPSAAAGYDTVHMIYLRQPLQLQSFAFHEWVEPPARLLAPLLVRALQATGAFRAVLLAPSAGTGALRLETELERLQQDFSVQPSRVRLTLRVVLIETATRRVVAAQVFDASAAAERDDPVAGVGAAQQATQRVLAEIAAASTAWAQAAMAGAAP
jgi:cholesterol transport system auxiliary component